MDTRNAIIEELAANDPNGSYRDGETDSPPLTLGQAANALVRQLAETDDASPEYNALHHAATNAMLVLSRMAKGEPVTQAEAAEAYANLAKCGQL